MQDNGRSASNLVMNSALKQALNVPLVEDLSLTKGMQRNKILNSLACSI